MQSDTAWPADDEPDPLLRPAWEDTPDETDADLGRGRQRPAAARADPAGAWPNDADLRTLLAPLCAAADALARLDASAAAADDAVRHGLIARLVFAEAAGFLAHRHAWVHPLDLSLREQGLTASTALAALGAGPRALPQTFAGSLDPRAWADPPFDTMANGDRAVAEALALARGLRRLAGKTSSSIFASAFAVMETLQSLGAGGLSGDEFAAWWMGHAPKPAVRRYRFGTREGEGGQPPLPPLLAASQAAQAWMEAAIATPPTPAQALLLAAGLLARAGAVRTVVLPVWAAYPAVGFGERDALPTLRSDAADRLVGRARPVTWPLAFLALVAESARLGLRALERLQSMAEQGRGVVAGGDKRSRLADALDALLRVPALTPKALAARLKVAPQTGTALLRELEGKGVVREVTGRGSFRAFAV